MRISKQPSGGRGEYEIAGTLPEDVTIETLTDRAIELRLGGLRLKTAVVLRLQGGKHRLRILPGGEMHAHRQVAAFLLLPKPIREEEKAGEGEPVVRRNDYVLSEIQATNVELKGDDRFSADVTSITCENKDHQDSNAEVVNVNSRLNELDFLFEHRGLFTSPLPSLLEQHRRQIESGAPLQRESEKLVTDVNQFAEKEADAVGIPHLGDDPVPALLDVLSVQGFEPSGTALDNVSRQKISIRKRTVKNVRRTTSRGPEAAKFRKKVREAYDSRCVMCGLKLPSTNYSKAGVEAAHILPWSDYDLDEVHNGVALCRLHHWAFEEGVLLISYDEASDSYQVLVPEEAEKSLEGTEVSLSELRSVAGSIPDDRLPSKRSNRPHPELLKKLEELVVD